MKGGNKLTNKQLLSFIETIIIIVEKASSKQDTLEELKRIQNQLKQ